MQSVVVDAYELAEHLARLAAGESTTIPADVRDLYARGAEGAISSDAIVAVIVTRYRFNPGKEDHPVLSSMQRGESAHEWPSLGARGFSPDQLRTLIGYGFKPVSAGRVLKKS